VICSQYFLILLKFKIYLKEFIKVMTYEIIREIGKGSFAKVFLCKYNQVNFFLLEEHEEKPFIVKEINLDLLVKKYKKRPFPKKRLDEYESSNNVNIMITPYSKRKTKRKNHSEQEYYYSRLKELVESEIQILKILNNDHITKFYSCEFSNEIYHLKMEYCDLGDVYTVLKGNANVDRSIPQIKARNAYNGMNDEFIRNFLYDTCSALEYLYNTGIIHRDIKLQNILVTREEKNKICFKLCDFGFACYDLSRHREQTSMTMSSICFDMEQIIKNKYMKLSGTPYYMSPEIVLNMSKFDKLIDTNKRDKYEYFYDCKSDLWSYGICLYELLFDTLPFNDMYIRNVNDLNSLVDIFNNPVDFENNLYKQINARKSINPMIKDILKQLLKFNYKERIPIADLMKIISDCNMEEIQLVDTTLLIQEDSDFMLKTNEINNNKNKEKANPEGGGWSVIKGVMSSWFKMSIDKTSNSIMKLSIDNKFKKWLME
jgi:serine/threonine protein kinase